MCATGKRAEDARRRVAASKLDQEVREEAKREQDEERQAEAVAQAEAQREKAAEVRREEEARREAAALKIEAITRGRMSRKGKLKVSVPAAGGDITSGAFLVEAAGENGRRRVDEDAAVTAEGGQDKERAKKEAAANKIEVAARRRQQRKSRVTGVAAHDAAPKVEGRAEHAVAVDMS